MHIPQLFHINPVLFPRIEIIYSLIFVEFYFVQKINPVKFYVKGERIVSSLTAVYLIILK